MGRLSLLREESAAPMKHRKPAVMAAASSPLLLEVSGSWAASAKSGRGISC